MTASAAASSARGAVEQQVGVGARHAASPRASSSRRRATSSCSRARSESASATRLELDEGPEALDLVEVDAHVLVEQQPAALVDDDQRPERGVERVAQRRRVADLGQAVRARARLLAVGSHVGDQARAGLAAAVLLAQLQPPARGAK